MAFNVQQFRSEMIGDGARPNLFEVTMQFPTYINPGAAATKLTFMCKSAQIPGSTVGVVPINYFGRELKFPGNRTFPDWAITIINDEDFIVRNAFEKWMDALNTHQTNVRNPAALPAANYSTDAEVIQYGKLGNVLKKYKFIGIFPSDVSQIDMDWGANDQFEEYSVTLSYQWWTSEQIGI